ncbi:AbrB/MazE/SpoVT family DNA-binding domain-containing protein [Haladaptatus sp. NG-WS-4]
MSTDDDNRRIDTKGRVTIPKSIRNRLNLEPGEQVKIEIEDGTVVIRPQISRERFIETMQGCINDDTRLKTAESMTPEELKTDWTSDLPDSA